MPSSTRPSPCASSSARDDRTKLDEYLHSVRDVEQRTERLDAWLDVPKPALDKKLAAPFQRDVPKAQAGEYWRTMFDLIVLALRTDMTRVVTYMNGSEGNGLAIPEIGITQARHNLSHHNGDPVVLERLAKSDAFIMEQFAHFLDRAPRRASDGDEPLLDRTMVLFGSGMSYGHSHCQQQPAHPPRRRPRPRPQARPAPRLQPPAPERRLHAQLRRMAQPLRQAQG